MAVLIIEIHVPFPLEPVVAEGEYPFPWIDVIEDFLGELEEQGEIEVFDDGEEHEDAYIFFVTGADERDLLAAASRTAKLEGVPAGVFAVISDDEAGEWGVGRRVDLPLN
ncbi:hypothetical protein PV646_31025 [Streptomyces sp. ID05-26A]|nr:hypothetical protein [Streptomyces sp. ID05-26A]